ncbi:MAG: hypothetical protein ACK501_23445 [Planctomycetota bacterium]
MLRHARSQPIRIRVLGLAAAFVAGPIAAQDLQAIRDQLRQDLASTNFAQSLLGLVMLSDELELGSATYEIDDGAGFVEGDLFGVDAYVQFGASLLIHTCDKGIPGTGGFAFGGDVMIGDDFEGWAVGFRLLF